ncbi:MAG TPA: acetyl-CoA carboxylase biotin carboxyl carrier protein [Papillibacter sp.]|nr:acetyl-CoA carboxylase biotin carboxyl carrier protein [Papillibacter sp.]
MSDIRQLAHLMQETGLRRLDYTNGDERILLEREGDGAPTVSAPVPQTACAAPETEHASENLYTVTSPIVGVFYAAPAPEEPPFVAIGDRVEPGDTLCIVEAMKMMNEITAEKGGTVVEICVGNKQIVEFGHPLFRLRLD